jgi:hypothetical protein
MRKHGFLLLLISIIILACNTKENGAAESGKLQPIGVQEILHITDHDTNDYLFGRLTGLIADADGSILVGDQAEKTIWQFTPDGDFIGNFGKEGSGPGEFGQFFNLSITRDDSLYVQDMMQSRILSFGRNSTGEWTYGSTIPLRRGEGGFPSSLHKIDDQTFLVHYMLGVMSVDSNQKPFLQLADRDGERVGEKILELEPFDMHIVRSENRVMAITIPLSYNQPYAVSSDGFIYTGFSEHFRISKYDLQGNHLLDIEYPVEPVPMSRAEKEEAVSGFGESAAEVRARIPDVKPAFIRLLVSDTGDLWVNRGQIGEESVWYVFKSDGDPLYEIRLPKRYNVSQIRHGNIYGLMQDEDDLQSIQVFRYMTRELSSVPD